MDKPTLNRARCKKCNDIITSLSTAGTTFCQCRSIFISGGNDHQKYGGKSLDDVDLSLSEYKK